MVDLKGIIDQGSPGKAIEEYYHSNQTSRDYLGLSEVGNPCKRYLYYRHHGFPASLIGGRVLRLFQLGNNIEDQAIIDLTNAGFTLTDNQKEVTFEHNNITLRGHIDGIIKGLVESSKPHLWECKSANEKSFNKLLKVGYEEWNPQYKAQIHIYALGLKLKNILAYVECKNDSRIYTERVRLDKEYAVNLLKDVFDAISREEPPERACPSQSWYIAKWCNFKDVCWKE